MDESEASGAVPESEFDTRHRLVGATDRPLSRDHARVQQLLARVASAFAGARTKRLGVPDVELDCARSSRTPTTLLRAEEPVSLPKMSRVELARPTRDRACPRQDQELRTDQGN